MKRFFLILSAFIMALSVMAETVKQLPRTICDCTIGESTYQNFLDHDKTLPKGEGSTMSLTTSKPVMVYTGDFNVDGYHMAIMSLSFYKDTLYKIECQEIELNGSMMNTNRLFVNQLKEKYIGINDDTQTEDTAGIVSISKKDEKTRMCCIGGEKSIIYSLTDIRLAEKAWAEEMNSIMEIIGALYNLPNPNYDEKNKVTSIAGVRIGETRTNTVKAFKQRGTFLKNENNKTYFSNVNFGGSTYNIAILYFQYDTRKNDMVFSAAKFEKNFYEWRKEEAVMTYESIISNFKGKYSNFKIIKDEDNAKLCACGMIGDDYANGEIPPIVISLDLGVSRGGDKFYYVTVSYFGERMINSVSDDI